ncbi:MAG: ATP-grasp domain-containing protein [Methanotrichaceae archaeon]|jgi:predicted ATP-grasp superfamily ATP-dependent carboligase
MGWVAPGSWPRRHKTGLSEMFQGWYSGLLAVLHTTATGSSSRTSSLNGEKCPKDFTVKAQSGAGKPILLKRPEEFEQILRSTKVDAGLLIAPDEMQPKFLEIPEKNTVNLGCSPTAASLCADKLLCTQALARAGVPVAEIVAGPEPCEKGCHRYVVKPRFGCGSENVRISSITKAGPDDIVTRYYEDLSLSASFIVGDIFCR